MMLQQDPRQKIVIVIIIIIIAYKKRLQSINVSLLRLDRTQAIQ